MWQTQLILFLSNESVSNIVSGVTFAKMKFCLIGLDRYSEKKLIVEGIDDASLGPTFTKKIIKTFSYHLIQKMPSCRSQINQVFLSLRYLISKPF